MTGLSWRFAAFLIIGTFLLIVETVFPKMKRHYKRIIRWPGNAGITLTNSLIGILLKPVMPLAVAVWAAEHNLGLLNQFELKGLICIIFTVLTLDMLVYWQHRLFHTIPLLRNIHAMHHTEEDLDVSSALRFHPLEIMASNILKMIFVLILGAPVSAVIIFEIILNGMAMFNHANIRIPESVDKILRLFVVTPDMHRIHHSVVRTERNSNYGFNISLWDRVFTSYTRKPAAEWKLFTMGLPGKKGRLWQTYKAMLMTPFLKY